MAVSGKGGSGGGSGAIRAGRAFVELTANDAGLRSRLESARQMVLGFGKKLTGVGLGLAGAGTAILGPLAGIFSNTIEHYDNIQKAADRLGTSAETISALGYAASQSGSDLEGLENSAKFLQKNLSAAAEDGGEAAKALTKLGLSAEDVLALPLDQQMMAIAEGLQGIENPADKAALAMQLLGKNGSTMLPLFKNGAAGIRDLMAEAGTVGAIVSTEDAANAEKVGDAIDRVTTSLKNTAMRIGAAFLPQIKIIESVAASFVSGIGAVREFIDENKTAIIAITGVGAALIAAGASFVVIGSSFALAATAAGGFASVIGAIFSPFATGVVAVTALAVAIGLVVREMVLATDAGQDFANGFLGMLGNIAGEAKSAFKGISSALAAGDIKQAWEIGLLGLRSVWDQTFVFIQSSWNTFKATFADEWHKIVRDIEVLWEGLAGEIQSVMFDMLISLRRSFEQTFQTIFKILAGAADALGDTRLANALNSIGAADMNTLQQAKILAERQHIERLKQIDREFEAEQEARNKSREQAMKEAREKAAASKKILDDRLKEIEAGKLAIGVFSATWAALHPNMAKVVNNGQRLTGATRGTFSSPNYKQFFGGGNVEQKQLKAQEDARKILIDVFAELQELNAQARPLVFQ